MVKIYIVRHGYSLGNQQGLITGHYDCDLTEYGFKQAKLLCDYMFKNVKVDKIYSSPLCRAINTIKPLADALCLPIEKEKAFIELAVGVWDGMLFDSLAELYPKKFAGWVNREEGSIPEGGEEWSELYARATKRIEEIVKEDDGKNVVICSHGGVLKALSSYFLGKKSDRMNDLDWASNASITEVWYDNGEYSIKNFSFDDYLGELKTALPKTV